MSRLIPAGWQILDPASVALFQESRITASRKPAATPIQTATSSKVGMVWIQGYNCPAAVDGDHQIIMAVGVSNQAADQHHHLPMVERIVANTGQLPERLIADAGYCSTANIEASEQRGLDAYISTSRESHGKRPRPSRGPAPRDLDTRGRMDRKLRSKAGQAIYALRKTVVEPVFGQIKGARGDWIDSCCAGWRRSTVNGP